MHRKRVTSELHDSYFCLMTIKHAIPKIEWAIEMAIEWAIERAIEWAIELLYNSLKTGSQGVGDQTSWRQDMVGKATPSRRSPQDPRWSLGTRPVGDKMQ